MRTEKVLPFLIKTSVQSDVSGSKNCEFLQVEDYVPLTLSIARKKKSQMNEMLFVFFQNHILKEVCIRSAKEEDCSWTRWS